jgi:hypothetical protein
VSIIILGILPWISNGSGSIGRSIPSSIRGSVSGSCGENKAIPV